MGLNPRPQLRTISENVVSTCIDSLEFVGDLAENGAIYSHNEKRLIGAGLGGLLP